jgi:hypothetical protein
MDSVASQIESLVRLLRTDANAVGALAALASAAVALLSLVVSVIALAASLGGMHVQRRHNRLSVRPIPEVTLADYEDSLRIKLWNNGSGPLIVKRIRVTDGKNEKEALIDWMPALTSNRPWNHFTHAIRDRALLPGKDIGLLDLTRYEGEADFTSHCEPVRRALEVLTVIVEFTDAYSTKVPEYRKSLKWFGRRWAQEST